MMVTPSVDGFVMVLHRYYLHPFLTPSLCRVRQISWQRSTLTQAVAVFDDVSTIRIKCLGKSLSLERLHLGLKCPIPWDTFCFLQISSKKFWWFPKLYLSLQPCRIVGNAEVRPMNVTHRQRHEVGRFPNGKSHLFLSPMGD